MSNITTKSELYKNLIDIHKSHGQGLSGIVRIKSSEISNYLDELIEEGLVELYDDGIRIGHPDAAKWYMPKKGYNVFKDGEKNGGSSTAYLTYVRLYLGVIALDGEPDGRENIAKWLNPSVQSLIQNPDIMSGYSEWLKRNKEELDIMTNLDDFYYEPKIEFKNDEIEWIKSRSWFKSNLTVSKCIDESKNGMNNSLEKISLNKELIRLYERLDSDNLNKINDAKNDIRGEEEIINLRKKVNKWLETLDGNKLIQDFEL